MTIAVSPLAGSQFSYAAGASGTVTVPGGCSVAAFSCVSAAGGTLVITPAGANQTAGSPPTITLLAGVPFSREWPSGGPLGPGTTLAFTSTDAYYVEYAKAGAGGMVP